MPFWPGLLNLRHGSYGFGDFITTLYLKSVDKICYINVTGRPSAMCNTLGDDEHIIVFEAYCRRGCHLATQNLSNRSLQDFQPAD